MWCAQVESVATTLSLAEQNHAEELKRVCLEFVSRNLQAVMLSEGYQHMVNSCPQLQVTSSNPSVYNCSDKQAFTKHSALCQPVPPQYDEVPTQLTEAVLLNVVIFGKEWAKCTLQLCHIDSSACRRSSFMSLLWRQMSVSTPGTRRPHATQALLWQSMPQMCLLMQRQGGSGRGASSHALPLQNRKQFNLVQKILILLCVMLM